MQIFQFMSIQRCSLLKRLLNKALSQDCIIVLDLEDTLSDIDIKKSKAIKEWGRSELSKFAYSNPDFFNNKKIGIRINRINSSEFEKDIKILSEISKIWDLFCIVAPMIENQNNIYENICSLKNKEIHYKTFIPIIETIKGLENISSIVDYNSIFYAIYGHNDYSLDSKHWPFLEHNELEFWKIVDDFIKKIENQNKHYIHPPIPYFSNLLLSEQVFLQLEKRCNYSYGIMTINTNQTHLINNLKNNFKQRKEKELKSNVYSHTEKIDKALYIKNLFSNKKRNFTIDPKTEKFFSPHEYISALNFLEKING